GPRRAEAPGGGRRRRAGGPGEAGPRGGGRVRARAGLGDAAGGPAAGEGGGRARGRGRRRGRGGRCRRGRGGGGGRGRRRPLHRGRRGGPRAALVRHPGDPRAAAVKPGCPIVGGGGYLPFVRTRSDAHLVWDWNGTLFHDMEAVLAATNASCAELGVPPLSLERYRELYCMPLTVFY